MKQVTTTEQIEDLYSTTEQGPEIYPEEIDAIAKWAENKGDKTVTSYYAIVAAFTLGVRRSSLYEKNGTHQENRRNSPSCGVEGQTVITADQGHDIQIGCYRLQTLLKLADRLIDSLPIQETETDREVAEDTRMVIQSARIILHQITNVIETVEDFGKSEKPSDL